jgi:hypothetical protein
MTDQLELLVQGPTTSRKTTRQTAVAMIEVATLDGRVVTLPRDGLVVMDDPQHPGRAKGRYLRPESVFEEAPPCAAPPAPRGWSHTSSRRRT